MTEKIRPIFIFSLPRAGSTLTQRVLGGHPFVATASEPWVLLPVMYSLRSRGVIAEYNHYIASTAINEFVSELSGMKQDYLKAVREFAESLYTQASDSEALYFLDKTPRYHLIVDEVMQAFPNAKAIFLWRNPLAIAASIMETWSAGRWNLYRYKIDIYAGLSNLVGAYEKYEDRAIAVNYEALIKDPGPAWKKIFAYLDLDYDEHLLVKFVNTSLKGQMGDPTGTKQYDSINDEPLNKWKITLANPLRKYWAARYLKWIGEDRLAFMGYDQDQLRSELGAAPSSARFITTDILLGLFGVLFVLLEPYALLKKLHTLKGWRKVYFHR